MTRINPPQPSAAFTVSDAQEGSQQPVGSTSAASVPVPESNSTGQGVVLPSELGTSRRQNEDITNLGAFEAEDPEQPVEVNGSPGTADNEGDGSGLGDGFDDIGPRDNEELEEATEDVDDGAPTPLPEQPRIPHPLPPWLLKIFDRIVEECSTRDLNGLSPLYADGKFFYPRASTVFLLRRNPEALAPEDLFNPLFFVWDPILLCDIPCPNCKRPLQRHTHIPRPRRVIDFDECFWLVGYRYRCRGCRCTFRSWDQRILNVLPPLLAIEFPARLSHRSGLSKTYLDFARSCYRSGMSAKKVSDALRVQHLLHYDDLQRQYLHHLASQPLIPWLGKKYQSFLPFQDRSPAGYHGYVPSSQYIQGMCDTLIEEHRHDYHQHMAMLPLTIASADHAHKVRIVECRVSMLFLQ